MFVICDIFQTIYNVIIYNDILLFIKLEPVLLCLIEVNIKSLGRILLQKYEQLNEDVFPL